MDKINLKEHPEVFPKEKERLGKETIWEHYFARKIAFIVTPLFIKIKMSPNKISCLSIFFGLVGSFLIAIGDFWLILIGAFLLQIWLILDKTDGLVARFTKKTSNFGAFLEELNGALIATAFFTSIGLAASRFPGKILLNIEIPSHLFIIFGILTSFFIIIRHLFSQYYKIIFPKKENIDSKGIQSLGLVASFYKIVVKFSGIYSLAQPIFIIALLLDYLGIYVLFYFILQGIMFFIISLILIYRASKNA